jgi:drug/metabolite transporter (DMT)-like permease
VGFSVAYLAIDAGIGALILFGGVQLTMFAGAVLAGEAMAARRWIGAGSPWRGWRGWSGPWARWRCRLAAVLAMLAAALGWGIYSLVGRRATDPLAETAANFVLAAPLCAVVLWHGRGRGRR